MRPDNPYFLPILFVVLALGGVGFMDDYIKIIKKDKAGLMGRVQDSRTGSRWSGCGPHSCTSTPTLKAIIPYRRFPF